MEKGYYHKFKEWAAEIGAVAIHNKNGKGLLPPKKIYSDATNQPSRNPQ